MTRTILLDDHPVLTRAALIDGDEVVRLAYHHPHRPHPLRGSLYRAKITDIDTRLNAAYADLSGPGGFLRRKGKLPPSGSTVLVEIRREPFGGKAAEISDTPVLRLPMATLGSDGEVRSGPLGDPSDGMAAKIGELWATAQSAPLGAADNVPPIIRLLTELAANGVDQIDVTSPRTRSLVQSFVGDRVSVDVVDAIGARTYMMDAEEDALRRQIDLPGGGRVIIDETEALTAIDLDLGGQGGQSVKGAADKLLTAALQALGHHARLADLGGQIVIDVPRGAISAPKIMRDRLTRTFRPLGRISVPAVTPEGLGVVIAPRPGPTLLERLTTPSGTGIRAGRVLADDVAAMAALHTLETALADSRTATLTLAVSPRLRHFVTKDAPALSQLRETYGPRLSVRVDEALEGEDIPYHVN
ncbi:ribonuclease E/G [Parvularcula sp. LCG005]|uniref:ribonuclease E/G n=1 Tax=Parvularcula sp. LCG005 TaxID=3078805 RepID=UPI002941C254|nr:ribonuclease E/G [Parvularcula sp. LCG005]WOI53789.1 ribonuclease E/G [Parvularcula sp. LCG005]